MTSNKIIKDTFANYADTFNKYMEQTRQERAKTIPKGLFNAMEYSLSVGGKRLRPVLCMASAVSNGLEARQVLPMALGLEMFHTATLIHDDMPCMDNDVLRRGMPSCHAKFGETMALLAGDALIIEGFEWALYNLELPAENVLHAFKIITRAGGASGVCAGQALDIFQEGAEGDPNFVSKIAARKTGDLISAAVTTSVALAGSDTERFMCYESYSRQLGLAFQIVDDILDVVGTKEELGKTIGKDAEEGKLTHVTAYGLDKARQMAGEASSKAREIISRFEKQDSFLSLLPEYLVDRTR